jgi:DNA-binding GntR family transcriptional regulator
MIDNAGTPTGRRNSSRDRVPSNERVYSTLKESIISGEMPPRFRLVEAEIAQEMGVSRTPVREALKRLSAEALVSRNETGTLMVHPPTEREIEDIYVIREVLDGLAARLAAQRIAEYELSKLNLTVDAMKRAEQSTGMGELVAANILFHDLIYEISGNGRLVRMGRELRDFVRRFSRGAFGSHERAVSIIAEHEAIVHALEVRDPEAAEAAARDHARRARTYIVSLSLIQELRGEPPAVASLGDGSGSS